MSQRCLEALFEIDEEFLGFAVPGRDHLDLNNIVEIFNAAVFPPTLIGRTQRANGDCAKSFGKFVSDAAYLCWFNWLAVVISEREIDLILSHPASRGSGRRILLASSFLRTTRLRFKNLKCSSPTP